ncbi:MAG: ATP-dependent DNA helicase RecG, partial [Myxococcota bacterium]
HALPADPGVELDASVQWVKGVGPRLAEILGQRRIRTVHDLLLFLPRRYEDRSGARRIADAPVGRGVVVEGEVLAQGSKFIKGRRRLEVVLGDESGHIRLIWFRVPRGSFSDRFAKGRRFRAAGTISDFRGQKQIVHPETTAIDAANSEIASEGIVPVYPEIEGIRPASLRTIQARVLGAVHRLPETLPAEILDARSLPTLAEAVAALHRPPPGASLDELDRGDTVWHQRLIYEELFLLQLVVLGRRAQVSMETGYPLSLELALERVASSLFPFDLTGAQARVLGQIESDLGRAEPMHRLIQGDVGSGKTAVALTAAAAAAHSGVQCALMAPTEILAEQHARNALKVLPKAGVRVSLLTGSMSAGEKRRTLSGLANGSIDVVVGTHAVIQEGVRFKRLALGIVDEQHRFGVMQRARFLEQGREGLGATPHILVMTATPIPRTLALTVYGDLDVSVIDELPPGRRPIETYLYRDAQRAQVYRDVRKQAEQGRQAYVVFPLVEESEAEGMDKLRDATSAATELAEGALKGLRLGLLHGRMSADEKDRVMRAFASHELDVLVSTTVIEVGVDVPNATVMVIENAERFGLSQLHQLRGRVGRGAYESFCFLVTRGSSSDDAWRRLNVMVKTNDGFQIAEEDLEIRGPGDFIGTRQSGLPLLSFANLARDQRVLEM